jgi:hypothetical protein
MSQTDRAVPITISPAAAAEVVDLEQRIGGPIASDACIIVRMAGCLVGWGDDYGTFRPLDARDDLEEVGERLLEVASDLWEAWQR